jgi:SpoVK/Ycf46/Vps4 family AAA+-type ATPase
LFQRFRALYEAILGGFGRFCTISGDFCVGTLSKKENLVSRLLDGTEHHLKSALVPTRRHLEGADLANLVNEAALLAARQRLKLVGMKQFEDAVMRTLGGIEKKRSMLSLVGRCRLTL